MAEELVKTLTTADPIQGQALIGPHKIDIIGTFGSGTVTPFSFTETAGKGAQLSVDGTLYSTTATDVIKSESPFTQWELTGSSGATVQIIATPIIAKTRDS